jgi:hypothetical protein
MQTDPAKVYIYHITDITNLQGIIDEGGLHSDAAMRAAGNEPTEIGYANIKWRRLHEYQVDCCEGRFVGEFVPFYFCPRSPMLYTINKGSTGRPPGCQTSIVHLVSKVSIAWRTGAQWAISDGNAGAAYTRFTNQEVGLNQVAWDVVRSDDWSGVRMNKKMTEFLVADFYPLDAFIGIGTHNERVAAEAANILARNEVELPVKVKRDWYFPDD